MDQSDFFALNTQFKSFLEKMGGEITADLVKLLDTNYPFDFISGYTKNDIARIYFEYDYEFLNITFWCENSDNKYITNAKWLTSSQYSKANADSNWKSFFPEQIARKEWELIDICEAENEDAEDIICEYGRTKHSFLEKWFCDCWKEAVKEAGKTIDAYFSIHDTIFKTNLNTGKEEKFSL